MVDAHRLDRLRRLRTRLREHASEELARRVAVLAGIEAELAHVRRAEDETRAGVAATLGDGSGGAALAWAYADGLARRATVLAATRVRSRDAVQAARDEVRARRREEEQLDRLAERQAARAMDVARRAAATALDELALRAHGRT
jgi:flagellar export protein FliJ